MASRRRLERQGRTGRAGRQPRLMSHRARRSRAEAPDEAVELAAGEVRRAFFEWASRFVALLVRDLAPTVARQRRDSIQAFGLAPGVINDDAAPPDLIDLSDRHREAHLNHLTDADCTELVVSDEGHVDSTDLLDGPARCRATAGVSEVHDVSNLRLHVQDERQLGARLERFDATVSSETNGANGLCLVWRTDATIEGIYREVGRAQPRAEKLEQAFRMLDKQSADELRTAGVPVNQVVPNAEARKQEWLRANTDLIKAEADLRRRVERIIADPLNQGRSVADIAKLLEEQAGYSTSRAVLTARDQTLKLYGQIQQERQQNAGVTRYIWTTSLDERVRPDHADLDGTIQRWDDPPIVDQRTGRRGHPGFDFQCRCSAVAVIDEPTEGEAPAEQQRQVELRQRAVEAGRAAPPRPRPPREAVMRPTQAELDAERARRAADVERLRLEREAEARIAAAREAALANVPPAIAPRSAAELVDLAQEAPRAAAKRAEVEAVVERGLVGKSLEELHALPFTPDDLATDASLIRLRSYAYFRQTGNVEDNFGAGRTGLPQIEIESDGAHVLNGRHRITVARELGLRQIIARVRKFGPRGGLLWEYIGPIRV